MAPPSAHIVVVGKRQPGAGSLEEMADIVVTLLPHTCSRIVNKVNYGMFYYCRSWPADAGRAGSPDGYLRYQSRQIIL